MNPARTSNLLLVDDIPENLFILSEILQASGCQLRHATSGKAAIEAALRLPPDLMILDIKMPGMDGLQVCARFKQEPTLRDIPVIFISALQDTRDKLAAFQAGGVDFVTKPFREKEVQARVQTHLELCRQRAQLQANFVQLQKLEELRDNLTHMIVHDMRGPLMTLDGHLNMLETFEAGRLSQDGMRYTTSARQSIARLNRMIFEMLTVSRLESGAVKLNLMECDLVDLAWRVTTEAVVLRQDYPIRFISDPGPLLLSVDQELIGRVMENLVSNALKYATAPDRTEVRLTVTKTQVRFEVMDDGPGIPAEDLPKIFKKFGRVGDGKRPGGTGLGLPFCKLAVEAHGGTIGVRSKQGLGSLFWFTLKLPPPPAPPA
jgi:signal transduction histidine kinase